MRKYNDVDKGYRMRKIISVENATFSYKTEEDAVNVMENLSISFTAGTFNVILGRNGSGKSTLAKMLNGLHKPIRGRVLVDGLDTASEEDILAIRKKVGMVFQNPDNQLVASVVEEDVAFGPENLGLPSDEIRQRVDAALQAVDMYAYRNASPHNLSGGQKQRIAIAGILAMEPECIVLDESTAMLDPKGRAEVLASVTRLCREKGITVILITHFMDEAADADRVVVMDTGKIILDGDPHTVFAQVELLKQAGLDVPQPTEFAYELKKAGIDLPTGITTVEACVQALTAALQEEK